MKKISYTVFIFTTRILFAQGCASVTERTSVYDAPWGRGIDEHLGPLKVTMHPAAQYDREPYGSPAIRGFRVGLRFETNSLTQASITDINASYMYAPLEERYDRTEYSMSVLDATVQPGMPQNNMYTIFLQPSAHLDESEYVKEGRYKLNINMSYEGKMLSIMSETHLAYETKRSVYFTPIVYLLYLMGGGWQD